MGHQLKTHFQGSSLVGIEIGTSAMLDNEASQARTCMEGAMVSTQICHPIRLESFGAKEEWKINPNQISVLLTEHSGPVNTMVINFHCGVYST